MSVDVLNQAQSEICKAIKVALPNLRECAAHGGRFDLSEIKQFAIKAPSVRVACLGSKLGHDGHPLALFTAFVMTVDHRGISRDAAALRIATALLALVTDNAWGLADLGAAHHARMSNLYSTNAGRDGVALWAVSWEQPFAFAPSDALDSPLLKELYLGFAPKIGAAHKADYIPVSIPVSGQEIADLEGDNGQS